MSELEEKLSALMSNPQLMQQIASMAQNMSQQKPEPQSEPVPPVPDGHPLLAMAQAAGQTAVDSNQQALLQALSAYLSPGKIHKLERAMRASRMAGAASMFLNSGGLQMLTGR